MRASKGLSVPLDYFEIGDGLVKLPVVETSDSVFQSYVTKGFSYSPYHRVLWLVCMYSSFVSQKHLKRFHRLDYLASSGQLVYRSKVVL